jgi:hypothetical protein
MNELRMTEFEKLLGEFLQLLLTPAPQRNYTKAAFFYLLICL